MNCGLRIVDCETKTGRGLTWIYQERLTALMLNPRLVFVSQFAIRNPQSVPLRHDRYHRGRAVWRWGLIAIDFVTVVAMIVIILRIDTHLVKHGPNNLSANI